MLLNVHIILYVYSENANMHLTHVEKVRINIMMHEFSGLEVVDKGCCGEGTYLWKLTCFPWQTPCADRQKYFYWDGYHPTEVVHAIIANKAYTSNLYSYPINIKDLAML